MPDALGPTEDAKRRLMPRPLRAASILTAASRAFARGGYAATSMDDVAAEADVSKLILYRHYDSKRDLYEAVLAEVETRLAAIEPRPAGLAGVSLDQAAGEAAATMLAILGVAREVPDAYRLLYQHAAHEPLFAARAARVKETGVTRIASLLAPHVADATLLRWTARLVTATADEAVLAWLDLGDPDRDAEAAERLVRTMGAMLAPLLAPRAG